MKARAVVLTALFCLVHVIQGQNSNPELRENYFYLDGARFFIKGIGYEAGAYPGMLPWARPFNADIIRADLERISDAGFNTIRTWSQMTNDELQVVSGTDLKIIMGLSIDPAGDFSDPSFVTATLNMVESVLNYSKNYDNIIAYLIMNEPMPAHIFDVGYSNIYTLWMRVIRMIHQMHPGRPVSFSNTCVGDFIDPMIFDFSAFNIYPYNPATVNHSHKYPAYVNNVLGQRTDDHPLIITEYGLSVSPAGPGNWGYGGNTPEEQADAIKYMYRSLIDGGATGSCIFIYSDGWWKAENEFSHDDAAEEWFGLVEYMSVDDMYGTPRIAWDSVLVYNRAIITSPKNESVYSNLIPVEVFTEDTVASFEIFVNNISVMEEITGGNYFLDTLMLSTDSLSDFILKFRFYNSLGSTIKTESINLLVTSQPVELPEIIITPSTEPVQGDHDLHVTWEIRNEGPLQTDSILDCVFYDHIGWGYGEAATVHLTPENPSFSVDLSYTSEADVLTLSAGINARFGNFSKRIIAHHTFLLADTMHFDPPSHDNLKVIQKSFCIYPNPAGNVLMLTTDIGNNLNYIITDPVGRVRIKGVLFSDQINISDLPPGYYILTLYHQNMETQFAGFIKASE